jgi:hypothetical protein
MNARRIFVVIALLLGVPAALSFAGGAGGVGVGAQYFDASMSNTNLQMAYITGYGYGVLWSGQRIGGFGTALLSTGHDAAGGVGGLIIGQELRSGPLVLAFSLWGGAGGASVRHHGYMLVFGEADIELGLRVLPWMQVVAYAGYQAWGNMVPGVPFSSAALSTPVIGIRIGWGAF